MASLTVAIALGLLGPFGGRLVLKMAEAAAEAQQHDMSYGKFSRMLWAKNYQRSKRTHN
jgi:hypothetical protein